jgi:hypothetical protein
MVNLEEKNLIVSIKQRKNVFSTLREKNILDILTHVTPG